MNKCAKIKHYDFIEYKVDENSKLESVLLILRFLTESFLKG